MSFNPPYTSQTSLLSYLGSSWNNVTVSPSATSATGMVTTSNGPPLTIPGEEKEAFVEDAPTNQDSKAILGSFSSPQVIPESLSRPEIIDLTRSPTLPPVSPEASRKKRRSTSTCAEPTAVTPRSSKRRKIAGDSHDVDSGLETSQTPVKILQLFETPNRTKVVEVIDLTSPSAPPALAPGPSRKRPSETVALWSTKRPKLDDEHEYEDQVEENKADEEAVADWSFDAREDEEFQQAIIELPNSGRNMVLKRCLEGLHKNTIGLHLLQYGIVHDPTLTYKEKLQKLYSSTCGFMRIQVAPGSIKVIQRLDDNIAEAILGTWSPSFDPQHYPSIFKQVGRSDVASSQTKSRLYFQYMALSAQQGQEVLEDYMRAYPNDASFATAKLTIEGHGQFAQSSLIEVLQERGFDGVRPAITIPPGLHAHATMGFFWASRSDDPPPVFFKKNARKSSEKRLAAARAFQPDALITTWHVPKLDVSIRNDDHWTNNADAFALNSIWKFCTPHIGELVSLRLDRFRVSKDTSEAIRTALKMLPPITINPVRDHAKASALLATLEGSLETIKDMAKRKLIAKDDVASPNLMSALQRAHNNNIRTVNGILVEVNLLQHIPETNRQMKTEFDLYDRSSGCRTIDLMFDQQELINDCLPDSPSVAPVHHPKVYFDVWDIIQKPKIPTTMHQFLQKKLRDVGPVVIATHGLDVTRLFTNRTLKTTSLSFDLSTAKTNPTTGNEAEGTTKWANLLARPRVEQWGPELDQVSTIVPLSHMGSVGYGGIVAQYIYERGSIGTAVAEVTSSLAADKAQRAPNDFKSSTESKIRALHDITIKATNIATVSRLYDQLKRLTDCISGITMAQRILSSASLNTKQRVIARNSTFGYDDSLPYRCTFSQLHPHKHRHPYTDYCRASFATQEQLGSHMKTHQGDLPWVCELSDCNNMYKTKDSLRKHVNGGHGNTICPGCQDVFSDQYVLKKHLQDTCPARTQEAKAATEAKRLVCPGCQESFTSQFNLKTHMQNSCPVRSEEAKAAAEAKKPICPGCHTSFINQSDLKKHMEKSCPARSEEAKAAAEAKKPICPDCHTSFTTQTTLKTHMLESCPTRSEEAKAAAEAKKPICPDCHTSFINQSSLKKHLQDTCPARTQEAKAATEAKRLVCPDCHTSFINQSSLKKHLQDTCPARTQEAKAATEAKKPICPGCHTSFTNQSNLNVHMRDSCPGRTGKPKATAEAKRFICSGCQESFTVQSSLNKHMRDTCPARTEEAKAAAEAKKPICPGCHTSFTTQTNLNKHMRGSCPKRMK